MHRFRRPLAAVAVAGVLGLAGCGGASDTTAVVKDPGAATPAGSATGAQALLQRAADNAAAQSVSMEVFLGDVVLMRGAADPASGASRFTLDIAALFGSMAGGLGGSTGGAGSPFGALDGGIEVVTDGTVAYVKMGPLGSMMGIPATTPWVKIADVDQARSLAGSFADPTEPLEQLRSVSADVTERGTEDVRGVRTTRYTAMIAYDKVMASLDSDQRAQLEQAAGSTVDLTSLSVPMDVWIDGEGLPRRVTLDLASMLTAAAAATGTGTTAGVDAAGMLDRFSRMTIEFFDFGAPVDVAAPPAGQVVDAASIPGLSVALGND
jgi:hypothetical protein